MNKTRYPEKNSLCKYDLSLEFFNELGIEVNDIVPLRKVFLISTNDGNKILKRVDYGVDRLEIISESLDYIKRTYKNIISYNKLKDGLAYKKWNDELYIVMDILDGREVGFSNPVEISLCAENIALMHKASKGLREHLKNKYSKDFLEISLKDKFQKAYDDLSKIKSIVKEYKYKNQFDELFINNVDNYLKDILDAKEKLNNSKYEQLRNSGDTVVLCHNDLAYHNFLTKKQEINIIDFDFMTLDLRVMDICDFILKSIKNTAFDIDKMLIGINGYENISQLKDEEKEILYINLYFPKDFYNISKDYYYKRKKWDYEVYLNRFKNKLENESFRYEFLELYKKNLTCCTS